MLLGQTPQRYRLLHAAHQRDGHQTDEVFVAQVLDDETRIGHRLGHDGARELTVGDLDREPLRRAFGQTQRQGRCDAAHLHHERGHERTAHRSDDAQRRVPGLEALQHGEVLAQRFELAANRAGAVEDANAELRGNRPPAIAHEELDTELGFELVHVTGDVRLDRVQAIGGRGERPLLGHREQALRAGECPLRALPSG